MKLNTKDFKNYSNNGVIKVNNAFSNQEISHLKKKIMSYNEIKRFIMFYERITLQMVKDLSKSASVVLLLKKNHVIKKVLFR